MSSEIIAKRISLTMCVLFAAVMAGSFVGCVDRGTGTGANSNSSVGATVIPTPTPVVLEAREPEGYSVTTTITVQPTGTAPDTKVPPLQFSFAKRGVDSRRLSFKLPDPVGDVIYLEKASFKYLIFPNRNQYVELDPNELGFQLGNVMSPGSVIERLKERTHYETIGTETISGRVAIKYRFRGAADTRTQAGTVTADSIVYVDQETGLPLRSEIETTLSNGVGAHVVTETGAIQLTPESSLFEVPTAMKKVTTSELKEQVQSFVNAIRVFAAYLRQQTGASPGAGN